MRSTSSWPAVDFDRGLDVAQTIASSLFTVVRADSTPVPVREALARRDFDSREAARRAEEASARSDTARAPRGAPPRPRAVRAGSEAALRPSRPPPITQVVLRLGALLVPGSSYRVTANGVRNLVGRPGTTSRVVQIPRPATDTTPRAPPP